MNLDLSYLAGDWLLNSMISKRLFCWLLLFLNGLNISLAQEADTVANLFSSEFVSQKHLLAAARFDNNLYAKLDEGNLQQIWLSLTTQFGQFKSAQLKSFRIKNDTLMSTEMLYFFERGNIITTINVGKICRKIVGLFFKPASTYRSPFYVKKGEFVENLISLRSDTNTIVGTLNWPNGFRKCTIIILIPGSGPMDRDETIGPNKVFRDLAEGIASKGIATFRYDKVTFRNKQFMPSSFSEEYLIDLQKIVENFGEKDSVEQIVLLGHSLGCWAAIQSVRYHNKIRGLILMASSPRPVNQIIESQASYLLRNSSSNSSDSVELQKVITDAKAIATQSEGILLGMPFKYWRSVNEFNAIEQMKEVTVPVLFMHGARDYQVTISDFHFWRKQLSANNLTFRIYDKLNHLFHEGESPSTPGEYFTQSSVSLSCIDDIVNWMNSK